MRRIRHIWKPVAVAVLVTALLACLAIDSGGHNGKVWHSDLALGLLPLAGSLDILPSGPGHLLAGPELTAVATDPFLSSLPPRGPPA
jgi:hypothetical protein